MTTTSCTYSFTITARRSPTLLPRVALMLSRRRLEPEELRYLVAGGAAGEAADRCTIAVRLRCHARAAERLHAQLAQLVDLLHIAMVEGDTPERPAGEDLAALSAVPPEPRERLVADRAVS